MLMLGASCRREGQGPGCNLSLAGGYPQVRAEGTLGVGNLIHHTASGSFDRSNTPIDGFLISPAGAGG